MHETMSSEPALGDAGCRPDWQSAQNSMGGPRRQLGASLPLEWVTLGLVGGPHGFIASSLAQRRRWIDPNLSSLAASWSGLMQRCQRRDSAPGREEGARAVMPHVETGGG
jgi:hypothetical protein